MNRSEHESPGKQYSPQEVAEITYENQDQDPAKCARQLHGLMNLEAIPNESWKEYVHALANCFPPDQKNLFYQAWNSSGPRNIRRQVRPRG